MGLFLIDVSMSGLQTCAGNNIDWVEPIFDTKNHGKGSKKTFLVQIIVLIY